MYNYIHFENCANSALFKAFLPAVNVEGTNVTVYDYFQGILHLLTYVPKMKVGLSYQSVSL
jgi:hypothetical protein